MRVDRYDLNRFEKKNLKNYSIPLLQLLFRKKLTNYIFKIPIVLLKVSTVPLKKRTVKQIPSVFLCYFGASKYQVGK